MSIGELLVTKNAIVHTPLEFSKEREKVSGAMWSGRLELEIDRVIYNLEMWYHFPEERAMTEREVIEQLGLRRIRCLDHIPETTSFFVESIEGVSYDAYWYTIVTNNKIFINSKGWFVDVELQKLVDEKRRKLRHHNQGDFTLEDEQELIDRGFEILITFGER